MKRFLTFAVLAAFMFLGFNSCENTMLDEVATYYGTVIDETTDMPFEGVDVKVTNGNRIYTNTKTDSDGYFSVEVRLQEINQDYYLLFGNSRIGTKRVEFPGFGNGRFDLGIITIKGPTAPIVETVEVSNIKSKMATGGGKVTSSGGYAVTRRGVCWSTSQYPTVLNEHTEDGTGVGEYFSNIGNLQPNTTYYVRAYAENEKGVAYGNQVTFTTESGVPIVKTKLVRVDGKTSVYYEGSVTDAGDSPVTERGICLGTSTPTIANQITTDGDGIGNYSGSITVSDVHEQDLYIRAYATNSSGTAYGEAIKIDHRNPYNLYKLKDGGVSYLVLPYDLPKGTWYNADLACKDLVAYDYNDWELPSKSVCQEMALQQNSIGGFAEKLYFYSEANKVIRFIPGGWSSEYIGSTDYVNSDDKAGVRPVRQY